MHLVYISPTKGNHTRQICKFELVLERKRNTIAPGGSKWQRERDASGGRKGGCLGAVPIQTAFLLKYFGQRGAFPACECVLWREAHLFSWISRDPFPRFYPRTDKGATSNRSQGCWNAQGVLAHRGKERVYLFWKSSSSIQIHQSVQLSSNTLSPMAYFHIQCQELQISEWNFPWMMHQAAWCIKQGL